MAPMSTHVWEHDYETRRINPAPCPHSFTRGTNCKQPHIKGVATERCRCHERLVSNQRNQQSCGGRPTCKSLQNTVAKLGRQPVVGTVYMQWHLCWKGRNRLKNKAGLGGTRHLPAASLSQHLSSSSLVHLPSTISTRMTDSDSLRLRLQVIHSTDFICGLQTQTTRPVMFIICHRCASPACKISHLLLFFT